MGDEKKPWEDVPIEIIIEEEERKKREREERRRPRLELPLHYPARSSSYEEPSSEEADEEHMIIIKL